MKKFLTFILVLAMVLSVSSVAMAWSGTGDGSEAEPYIVNDETSLNDALEATGMFIKLGSSFNVSKTITINRSVTIDGDDKTITYTGSANRAIDIPTSSGSKVNVTIKDLTVSGSAQRGINYNDDGILTLENVNVGTFTYALNLPGSSDGCNVNVTGGSLTGCIALNVWGANSTINVTGATLTSVDDSAVEGYAAVKLNNDGVTSAEGTVITITDGSIGREGTNKADSAATTNATSTGKINISNTTSVDGEQRRLVAVIRYTDGNSYGFTSIEDAVAKAEDGDTITLLADCSGNGIVIDKSITIDFDGHTYTVTGNPVGSTNTKTQAFQILKDNTVTLKDGTLTSTADSGVKMLVQNYSNLTLENMKLDGSGITDNPSTRYTLSNNSGNVTIEDTEIIAPAGGVAFDVCKYSNYTEPKVTVSGNSKINGKIEVTTTEQTNLRISGGEFSEKPNPAWVDTGKVAVGDGNGYSIKDKANESVAITVKPEALQFGSVAAGYSAPAAQKVVVTNIGQQPVHVSMPANGDYIVTASGKIDPLATGDSVEFTVVPKTGLGAGAHNATFSINASNSSNFPVADPSFTTINKTFIAEFYVEAVYSGPDLWYIGGNTFGTTTNQVPTKVEIDGNPVPFTMNGSQIVVGCVDPNANWVKVSWGSTTNTVFFTPDASVVCTQVGIPKTGDMSFWAAVAAFFGF